MHEVKHSVLSDQRTESYLKAFNISYGRITIEENCLGWPTIIKERVISET